MAVKKSHAQYEEELFLKEIDHWPLEEYKGTNVPILHECIAGHTRLVKPNSVLSNIKCPTCSGKKQKTHEEYLAELLEKGISIIPIEKYISSMHDIKHICVAGHIWLSRPNSILSGRSCKICSGLAHSTHEEYLDKIRIDAYPIENYINVKTPILHICSKNHEWKSPPNTILAGHGCKQCSNDNLPGGYNYTRFAKDRNLATSPGLLYIVVLVNKATDEKTCVKVGITKGTSNRDVLKRASGFKGYDVRIQKLYKGSLEEVFKLEQEIHSKFSEHSYKSEWKFGGATELFNLDKLSEILNSLPA